MKKKAIAIWVNLLACFFTGQLAANPLPADQRQVLWLIAQQQLQLHLKTPLKLEAPLLPLELEADNKKTIMLKPLELSGWLEKESFVLSRQYLIKGASITRQEAAYRYQMTPLGEKMLLPGHYWPIANVRLNELQAVNCELPCLQVFINFSWSTQFVYDWILADVYRDIPLVQAMLKAEAEAQAGSALLLWDQNQKRWKLSSVTMLAGLQ